MPRSLLLNIELLTKARGGRSKPIAAGYSPHLVVEGSSDMLGVRLTRADEVAPGGGAVVRVKLLYDGVDYSPLQPGVRFTIREGSHVVGSGLVVAATLPPGTGP